MNVQIYYFGGKYCFIAPRGTYLLHKFNFFCSVKMKKLLFTNIETNAKFRCCCCSHLHRHRCRSGGLLNLHFSAILQGEIMFDALHFASLGDVAHPRWGRYEFAFNVLYENITFIFHLEQYYSLPPPCTDTTSTGFINVYYILSANDLGSNNQLIWSV